MTTNDDTRNTENNTLEITGVSDNYDDAQH